MPTTQESIKIDLPVATVYNQWTQFEDFPKFMGTWIAGSTTPNVWSCSKVDLPA